MLVQALVTEASIEALDEFVLHGLSSRRDVVPFDLSDFLPTQDGFRR